MLFRSDRATDLRDRPEVTFALLSDASWKTRGVEEITVGSALSMTSRRSYQCADVGAALGSLRPRARTATLLLPVTTLPKRPLLGFDVSVPDRQVAFLPPRAALAEIEAEFVLSLARQTGVVATPALRTLIVAVCGFTPGSWTLLGTKRPLTDRLAHFVTANTGWHLDRDLVATWIDAQRPARELLARALGLPPDNASSSENPALAMPFVRTALGIGPHDVLGLIEEYTAFVRRCASAPESLPFAAHAVLAEYGRRWELMVECTVPLDGPFIVRVAERRPLELSRRGHATFDVTVGDAVSNHTVVRVADESVRIRTGSVEQRAVDDLRLPDGYFDNVRETAEEVALYTASEAREYRMFLRLRLATTQGLPTVVLVVALTLLSALLMVSEWRRLSAADLAVLVIPTTFAASLAVTRERTTLAAHLQRARRAWLVMSIAALWALVALWYVADTEAGQRFPEPAACARTVTPPVLTSRTDPSGDQRRRCDGEEHR